MERLHLNTSSATKNMNATGGNGGSTKCATPECQNRIETIQIVVFAGRTIARKFCTDCIIREEAKRTEEVEAVNLAEATKRLNLPPRFTNCSFGNFKKELQPTAYLAASGFAENYTHKTTRGLYLFGHAGSGKTHLAAAIGNQLLQKADIKFITAPELLLEIRKTFNTPVNDGLLDKLSQTRLLIIDDLGSEKPTEWVQETLFVLIDRRYTHFLPTVITSNYSLDQLKDRLGYRTASRIAEVSEMVELRASDYRIRKKV